MLKKYFVLTNKNEINFVGEFENFSEAWEHIEYTTDQTFVWLFKEDNLRTLIKTIEKAIEL